MRRLNSTNVSSAVRSTAWREPSEGGFSSTISSLRTRPVRMRKSRTALVMLASAAPSLCRLRISAAVAALGVAYVDVDCQSRPRFA